MAINTSIRLTLASEHDREKKFTTLCIYKKTKQNKKQQKNEKPTKKQNKKKKTAVLRAMQERV